VNLIAIAQGSSESNISFVIDEKSVKTAREQLPTASLAWMPRRTDCESARFAYLRAFLFLFL